MQLDILLGNNAPRTVIRTDVKANDDRAGGYRQLSVGLSDSTDTAANDSDRDFVGRELFERIAQCLEATLYVGFDQQVKRAGLTALDLRENIFELGRTPFGKPCIA